MKENTKVIKPQKQNKKTLRFKDLPYELCNLFVRKTLLSVFIVIIAIVISAYMKNLQLFVIAAICCFILLVLNYLLYRQLISGNILVLEATVIKLTENSFKIFSKESKVEMILQKDNLFYYVDISKKQAHRIAEGMKLRIYLNGNNVYQKENGQVILLNPLSISTIS